MGLVARSKRRARVNPPPFFYYFLFPKPAPKSESKRGEAWLKGLSPSSSTWERE